jgi:hypothetical protein
MMWASGRPGRVALSAPGLHGVRVALAWLFHREHIDSPKSDRYKPA